MGGVSLEPAGKGCQLLYCARLVKVRFEYTKSFFCAMNPDFCRKSFHQNKLCRKSCYLSLLLHAFLVNLKLSFKYNIIEFLSYLSVFLIFALY